MNRSACLLVTVVTLQWGSAFADESRRIAVPAGGEIVLDGNLDVREWEVSVKLPLAGGGTVHLRHDAGKLYVCLEGKALGWGHVYLASGDAIRVLHASAALGTAVYRHDGDEGWNPTQTFEWTLRDTSMSEEALAARAAFLETHGWVANTTHMGSENVLEYVIDVTRLDENWRLAVAFASDPAESRFWPATVVDDARNPKLVAGSTPAGLQFDTATWAKLELKTKKERP